MRFGVSGTTKGATPAQKATLREIFRSAAASELAHGGAEGVDEEADAIFRSVKGTDAPVRVYPSTLRPEGNYQAPRFRDIPREPLTRNKIIAQVADFMVIVPRQPVPIRRSGTWATYRYSLAAGKLTMVVLPDGQLRIAS